MEAWSCWQPFCHHEVRVCLGTKQNGGEWRREMERDKKKKKKIARGDGVGRGRERKRDGGRETRGPEIVD